MRKLLRIFSASIFLTLISKVVCFAQTAIARPGLDLNAVMASPQFSNSVQMVLALSLISLVPFFLISVTSFLRIVIVLSVVRTAIGTAQVPPNPVIIGLAIFMTVFIMNPVWEQVNKDAITPYNQGRITQEKALERGMKHVNGFMLRQTRARDLELFLSFAKIAPPSDPEKIPSYVLIPAFMISELKTAFQIGFLLFVPFVIIDLVVANILLSLGMFMLSPVMVSLPFKILLFVLSDGWNLIIRGLLLSFR
ncbi:flagellar type III secretion system pore protein FliP [Candidatus Margulisiibacteriota bacterium]